MNLADLRILVLEDEPIVGMLLEDMLLETQAVPLYAQDLGGATGTLQSERVDAAILDVNIHGEHSYPVADILLARGIPFIFATGYGDVLHEARFAHVPTVTKPYSFADIAAGLRRAGVGDD